MANISPDTMIIAGSVMLAITMAGTLFSRWMRVSAKEREHERELAAKQAENQRMEQERSRAEMMHLTKRILQQSQSKNQNEANEAGPNAGGYIIFDMPEAKKGVFHDLLKGFEDYAKLRGYSITFSIDNSFPNKTAFKFTFDNRGINVSSAQVRQDLKDYLNKVEKGESIDDLPVILSPEEHSIVLTHLKNRINFLTHTLTLEKNATELYKDIAKQISTRGFGIVPPQNFYIGDGHNNQSFQALNSPQAAVGTGNRLIGNRQDQSIYISNSFNERTEQVQALSNLWMALHTAREKDVKGRC